MHLGAHVSVVLSELLNSPYKRLYEVELLEVEVATSDLLKSDWVDQIISTEMKRKRKYHAAFGA